MKISRYFVEIILLSIVACLVASPFMKSDVPPTVIHDTIYFLWSTNKNGIWLKQKDGMFHFYKVDTIKNEEFYIPTYNGYWDDRKPAPTYGINIDSCYSKMNGWDGVTIDSLYIDGTTQRGLMDTTPSSYFIPQYLRQSDKKKTMSLDKK